MEIVPELFEANKKKFKINKDIRLYLGDCIVELPKMIEEVNLVIRMILLLNCIIR